MNTLCSLAVGLLLCHVAAAAPGDLAAFEGEWRLFSQGKEVEVGRWGGKEVRGPYKIVVEKRGHLSVMHGSTFWLALIPVGPNFVGYRGGKSGAFEESYQLGPDLGPNHFQVRVRPGGNELELWKRPHAMATEFLSTGYTLVRGAKSYSGAASDFSL